MVTRAQAQSVILANASKLADALGVDDAAKAALIQKVRIQSDTLLAAGGGGADTQLLTPASGQVDPIAKLNTVLEQSLKKLASPNPKNPTDSHMAASAVFAKAEALIDTDRALVPAKWATKANELAMKSPEEILKGLQDNETRTAALVKALNQYPDMAKAIAEVGGHTASVSPEKVPGYIKKALRGLDTGPLENDINMGANPRNKPDFYMLPQFEEKQSSAWIANPFNPKNYTDPTRSVNGVELVPTKPVDVRDLRKAERDKVGAVSDAISQKAMTPAEEAERLKQQRMGAPDTVLPEVLKKRGKGLSYLKAATENYVDEYKERAEYVDRKDGREEYKAGGAVVGSVPNAVRQQTLPIDKIDLETQKLKDNAPNTSYDVIRAAADRENALAAKEKDLAAREAALAAAGKPAASTPATRSAPSTPSDLVNIDPVAYLDASQANRNPQNLSGHQYKKGPQVESHVAVDPSTRPGNIVVIKQPNVVDSQLEIHAKPGNALVIPRAKGINDTARHTYIPNGDQPPGLTGPKATLLLDEEHIKQLSGLKKTRAVERNPDGTTSDYGTRTEATFTAADGSKTTQHVTATDTLLAQQINPAQMTKPVNIPIGDDGMAAKAAVEKSAAGIRAEMIAKIAKYQNGEFEGGKKIDAAIAITTDSTGRKTGEVLVDRGDPSNPTQPRVLEAKLPAGTIVTFSNEGGLKPPLAAGAVKPPATSQMLVSNEGALIDSSRAAAQPNRVAATNPAVDGGTLKGWLAGSTPGTLVEVVEQNGTLKAMGQVAADKLNMRIRAANGGDGGQQLVTIDADHTVRLVPTSTPVVNRGPAASGQQHA